MTDSKYATRSSWLMPEAQIIDLTLPSGNVVGIRDLTLLDAIAETVALEPVSGMASRIVTELSGESAASPMRLDIKMALTLFGATPELYELTGPLCKAVFVAPKIVDAPQADDEIPLELLSKKDRFFVLMHFLGFAEELMAFFPQPGDGDSAGSTEPALREDAE
jgi:hypothetical protein